MPELELNRSSPVNSPSIFPVQGWSGIYMYFIRICWVPIADQTSHWLYLGFVEENGSITFGMLTAADLGLQKMKTSISDLFFWSLSF